MSKHDSNFDFEIYLHVQRHLEISSKREIAFPLFLERKKKKKFKVCYTSIGGMLGKLTPSCPGPNVEGLQWPWAAGHGEELPGSRLCAPGQGLFTQGTEAVWPTPRACRKAGSEPGFPTGSKHLTTWKRLLVIYGQRQSTNQVAVT